MLFCLNNLCALVPLTVYIPCLYGIACFSCFFCSFALGEIRVMVVLVQCNCLCFMPFDSGDGRKRVERDREQHETTFPGPDSNQEVGVHDQHLT